jgi:hypothetical protein
MASWHGAGLSTGTTVPPYSTLNVVMLVSCPLFMFLVLTLCIVLDYVITGSILIHLQVDLILMRHHLTNNFGCGGGWADSGAWLFS